MCLSEVPVGDLAFLANSQELVVVHGSDCEVVESAHALGVGRNSLFGFQVPAENGAVSRAGQQVLVVREQLDKGHFLGVFFEVRHQLARPNFPNADVSFHAS